MDLEEALAKVVELGREELSIGDHWRQASRQD
jgi:hypothetical protein